MTTPKLALPELSPAQASKELTHNQALATLDQLAMPRVVDKDLTAPPGSPVNGAMYIPAAGATGAWAGKAGYLAWWLSSAAVYTFLAPALGMSVRVLDELDAAGLPKIYAYSGTAWVEQTGGSAGMANPMTTAGDLIVGGAAGVPARLPVGAPGKVLGIAAGAPAWVDPSATGASLSSVQTFTGPKTLALTDINTYNVSQDATAQVVTLPAQATVTWTDHAEIHIERGAAGTLTIVGATGVQINGTVAGTFTLGAQYSVVTLKRKAANLWTLFGNAS